MLRMIFNWDKNYSQNALRMIFNWDKNHNQNALRITFNWDKNRNQIRVTFSWDRNYNWNTQFQKLYTIDEWLFSENRNHSQL